MRKEAVRVCDGFARTTRSTRTRFVVKWSPLCRYVSGDAGAHAHCNVQHDGAAGREQVDLTALAVLRRRDGTLLCLHLYATNTRK